MLLRLKVGESPALPQPKPQRNWAKQALLVKMIPRPQLLLRKGHQHLHRGKLKNPQPQRIR